MAAEMVEGIGDMKSIGHVDYDGYHASDACPWRWEQLKNETRSRFEAGAKAVLLHTLDLLAATGVTPADAARELRAGRTLGEVTRLHGFRCSICLDIAEVIPEEKLLRLKETSVCIVSVDAGKVTGGMCAGKIDEELRVHARGETCDDKRSCAKHDDCDAADKAFTDMGSLRGVDHEEPPCSGSPEALARIGKVQPCGCGNIDCGGVSDDEHQCGGPKESCGVSGCNECGHP